MGAKLIGGFVGFVIVALFLQSYVFGGDDGGPSTPGRGGAVPTATLPAQLPQPIVLAESAGGAGGGASTNAGGGSTRAYVVKSGDTLGAIASGLGVPADQQAAWINQVLDINNIADARNIQVGVELQVPAPAPTARPSATVRPSGSATVRPFHHRHTGSDGAAEHQPHRPPGNDALRHTAAGCQRRHLHRGRWRHRLRHRREVWCRRPGAVARTSWKSSTTSTPATWTSATS